MNEAREISKPAPDRRHHLLLCEADKLYREANDNLPMPDAARFARSLKLFLDSNPKWSAGTLLICLRNRFASKNVNLGAPPHTWIALLPLYLHGPLDEWGRSKAETRDKGQGTSGSASSEEQILKNLG